MPRTESPKHAPKGQKRCHSDDEILPEPKKINAFQGPRFAVVPESILKLLKETHPEIVVRRDAAIYLSGLMEYVAAEIVDVTMQVALKGEQNGKVKLTGHDIEVAIQSDSALSELWEKVNNRPEE